LRILRVVATASKGFPSSGFIWDHLLRAPDFQSRITIAQIDGIVTLYAGQVNDVSNVPAYHYVNPGYSRYGYVLCVHKCRGFETSCGQIAARQLCSFLRQFEVFPVAFWDLVHDGTNSWRCLVQLDDRQIGKNQHGLADPE